MLLQELLPYMYMSMSVCMYAYSTVCVYVCRYPFLVFLWFLLNCHRSKTHSSPNTYSKPSHTQTLTRTCVHTHAHTHTDTQHEVSRRKTNGPKGVTHTEEIIPIVYFLVRLYETPHRVRTRIGTGNDIEFVL